MGFAEKTRNVKLDSWPGSKVVGTSKYPPCSKQQRALTCNEGHNETESEKIQYFRQIFTLHRRVNGLKS